MISVPVIMTAMNLPSTDVCPRSPALSGLCLLPSEWHFPFKFPLAARIDWQFLFGFQPFSVKKRGARPCLSVPNAEKRG